jgi:hypothetical protein
MYFVAVVLVAVPMHDVFINSLTIEYLSIYLSVECCPTWMQFFASTLPLVERRAIILMQIDMYSASRAASNQKRHLRIFLHDCGFPLALIVFRLFPYLRSTMCCYLSMP